MTPPTQPQPDQSGIGWPTPRKPTGATDITPDRWMWIEPELEPWFALFHLMLTDMIRDGPFESLRARMSTPPETSRWAGQFMPCMCRDGKRRALILVRRGLSDVDSRRFTAHEIGHFADFVAHSHLPDFVCAGEVAWQGDPLRANRGSEAVARQFETNRWSAGSRGTDALDFVRRARRHDHARVSGASHAALRRVD